MNRNKTTKPTRTKPLQPTVTLEQIFAFDKDNPETYTPSAVLNAVLEAMQSFYPEPYTGQKLADYLCVDFKKLSYALEIITGHEFSALRYYWVEHHLKALPKRHPKWTKDQIARWLGFYDRTSVNRLLKSRSFKQKQRINVRQDQWTEVENHQKKMREIEASLKAYEEARRAREEKFQREMEIAQRASDEAWEEVHKSMAAKTNKEENS